MFLFWHVVFFSQVQSKVTHSVTKGTVMSVNLNIDDPPISSRSHTHPSHSQNSESHLLSPYLFLDKCPLIPIHLVYKTFWSRINPHETKENIHYRSISISRTVLLFFSFRGTSRVFVNKGDTGPRQNKKIGPTNSRGTHHGQHITVCEKILFRYGRHFHNSQSRYHSSSPICKIWIHLQNVSTHMFQREESPGEHDDPGWKV
jgi:hypothetical protein